MTSTIAPSGAKCLLPNAIRLSSTGRKSRPRCVGTYSKRGGCALYCRLSSIPDSTSEASRTVRMFGAMSRLSRKSSKRVKPCSASRKISMLHHSPTRSSERAIGQCIFWKLFRRIGEVSPSYLHYASDSAAEHPCASRGRSRRWGPGSALAAHTLLEKAAQGGLDGVGCGRRIEIGEQEIQLRKRVKPECDHRNPRAEADNDVFSGLGRLRGAERPAPLTPDAREHRELEPTQPYHAAERYRQRVMVLSTCGVKHPHSV